MTRKRPQGTDSWAPLSQLNVWSQWDDEQDLLISKKILSDWRRDVPRAILNSVPKFAAIESEMKVQVIQLYPTLCNPMEFSRPEYWSG